MALWRAYEARIEELTAALARDRYGVAPDDHKHWERAELQREAVTQAQAELTRGTILQR